MTYVRMIVGENIRKFRHLEGLTQKQLAELLVGGGTNESYFRSIENGHKAISLVRVVEVADTLGIPPADLLAGL